jgi:ribonuclease BN (tRNA processing enzyme)
MKLKIYGATGSFPKTMGNEEILQKLYSYQVEINKKGGFKEYLKSKGFDKLSDKKDNISIENFRTLLDDPDEFDFWIGHTYGGDTPSLYIKTDDNIHIALDCGAGFIKLSKDLAALEDFSKNNGEVFIFLSHYHWDHVQGLPFSALIFTQNKMRFFGMPVSENEGVKEVLESQMNKINFPIPLDLINKSMSFYTTEKPVRIGENTKITPFKMEHPLIGSYTYKIEDLKSGKSIVYATDFEQAPDRLEDGLIKICKGADILIIDAHFTPGEASKFVGWGHGNFGNAVDLARLANIKNLIIFHHNFTKTDEDIFNTEKDVLGYVSLSKESFDDFELNVHFAREGLEIDI